MNFEKSKSPTSSEEMDKSQESESDEEVIPPPKSKKKAETKAKKTPEKKSYRCDRCNFSSSSKAKYTKHAKSAHSGTIVQCDHCEFKTPYKWNLDRHYKNHLGGGALCCHLCNFSCDIKQSLTVHLQNHHSNVPEEIIESVKRQQIPPRNQSINKKANANANPIENTNSNGSTTKPASPVSSKVEAAAVAPPPTKRSESPGASSDGEKKVPPLRISRSLTGLSLGDENNSGDDSPPPPSSNAGGVAVAASVVAVALDEDKNKSQRKCELCDFETSGDGSGSMSSVMKKHMASTHGVHRKHHHKDHKRERAASSSPEHGLRAASPVSTTSSSSPNIPVVPISLPPKKSKGATSPRPGQSASSTNNSPAIHRSQSPMKASEAINAFGGGSEPHHHNNLQAAGPSEEQQHHPQSALNLVQSTQLASVGEQESAFTPIVSGTDFTHAQLSSLKKPKQRALAQFYQKIKPKFTTTAEDEANALPIQLTETTTSIVGGGGDSLTKEETNDDPSKNLPSSKSNRCQHCRQRCKSSADLATHLEKCVEASGRKESSCEVGGESHEQTKVVVVKEEAVALLPMKPTTKAISQWNGSGKADPMEEIMDDGEYESKTKSLNSSSGDPDDLIGFETAPGVGAIHTGKMEEMEYQGYSKDGIESPEEEGETSENQAIPELDDELDDEMEEEEGSTGSKKGGKGGKAQVTNRKVYRCPENDCSFWATTASRFHVHIVGHYNLKPFECSECHYKSNWRWDVNKHIRLKTPKDPKHAVAKTLLTHESGQRDYRKYDNYLVTMSLLHSANAKAPDCSTVATKRTKTPKSSPVLTATPKQSPTGSSCSSSLSTPISPAERKSKSKLSKSQALSLTVPVSSVGSLPGGESSPFHQHSNLSQHQQPQQPEDGAAYPMDMASSGSPSEGRSFVETRMLAGGEIYQTSVMKQDTSGIGERELEEGGDVPPSGFDLTLKRPRSRHPHQEEEMKREEMESSQQDMQGRNMMMPVIPTKKSRLQQQHRLEQQQQQQEERERNNTASSLSSGATNGSGNKILSLWQCIKCNFKHMNKEIVNSHIKELHKPKKGDPVSLLSHNHLVQVIVPEQDGDVLMASSTSGDLATDFSMNGASDPKKEMFQPVFIENGKVLSCKFCPFTTGLLYEMEIHAEHHLHKSQSYYSCPHCSYSVAVKSELHEHLKLHGEMSPQQLEIQNRLINSSTITTSAIDSSRLSLLSPSSTMESLNMTMKKDPKKGQCVECPYITNDLSEFQYHRQCHEANNYPFKCHKCSFNVSVKLHLLQHLRVHGIQIDEAGVPPVQPIPDFSQQFTHHSLNTEYESISDDGYSPNGTQEEPLNLSIFANRKPVIVYDTNGVPMEGYKCSVCPQIFQDLNDLKEHEFVNNHRSTRDTSSSREAIVSNASTNFPPTSRQCDSPPMEAMNLSVKLSQQSTTSNKKSSQSSSKAQGKRSGNSGSSSRSQAQTSYSGSGNNNSVPMSISSPSSMSSVDTSISSAPHNSSSSKAEKEYIYLCDSCPARFFFEKELKIHQTFHENKSTFQCPKCTYSARQKDPHLMSHMRVHGATYQEKTKALLTKFPRGKVNPSSSSSSSAATAAAYQAAAAAALSAASLLNLNTSLLNSNFNFQTAAAALSSAAGKNAIANVASAFSSESSGLEGLRKNGLSMMCPKCPEKFFNPQAFQQHLEQHSNGRGGTEYRCRFCDYWAESRKAITVHEIVHTGTDNISHLEPAVAKLLSSSMTSAFNPVSMMAMVAHQDSPFTSPANPPALIGGRSSTPGDHDVADKNSGPVPDEAYEGNPDFVYPTYMKNGRVKSKRYKCMKCPSAFEKKDQYHTHTGLHGSNQKYKCTVCDYAVTYYANYIQHLKKHENQRNIPTELLNLGRKRHPEEDPNTSLLKISKLSEPGENSSSSSISANSNGSSFDSNSENQHNHHQHQLHLHQNGLVNGGILKCSYCPFHCFDETTLDGHVIHHQENPNWLHVCNICTFRCSSKKSLKEHSRLHLLNGFHHRIQAYQQAPQQQQHQKYPELKNGGMPIMSGMNSGSGHGHHDKQKNGDMSKGEYLNGYNGRDDIGDVSSDGSM